MKFQRLLPYGFASGGWLAILAVMLLTLEVIPAKASVFFQFGRLSDTQAVVTGSGSLDGPKPLTPNLGILEFDNPFGLAPSGTDNSNVFQSATLQIGGYTIDFADTAGPSFNILGNNDPTIYFQNTSLNALGGGFSVGDSVSSGNLLLQLVAGTSFAPVGTTGDVYWGAYGTPTVVGSWEIVSAVGATPLPPALPLFAAGLGALVLLGWRRKNQTVARAAF